MPWFPDFVAAAELARREIRAAGQGGSGCGVLRRRSTTGDTHTLETVWPGEVVVYDPRAGEIRGHRQLRQFVRENRARWADAPRYHRDRRLDSGDGRAVVELSVHLDGDGEEVVWPLAVVAESHDDVSVEFRTYCSQWPVDGRRHLRPPILEPGHRRPVMWSAATWRPWTPATPRRS